MLLPTVTLLPAVTPWLLWRLAVLMLGTSCWLLMKSPSAARWRYAALVLLVIAAAARPGVPGATAAVRTTELNVFFVVDTTPSAAAEDFNGASPRLDGMKADILAVADELAGARFSLISFDSTAVVELPLTTDATALRTLSEVLAPRTTYNSQGSSISVANSLLAQRLAAARQTHPERPRLVYYLGDGEQTAAKPPAPFKESAALVDGGAVLGYGTEAGGKMREQSFNRAQQGPWIPDPGAGGAPAVSTIDEQALQKVAAELNVPYVHREAPDGIAPALTRSVPHATSLPHGQEHGAGRWELYWVLALAACGVALWELSSLLLLWRRGPRCAGKDRA